MKFEGWQLKQRQNYPLDLKEKYTANRIRSWYDYAEVKKLRDTLEKIRFMICKFGTKAGNKAESLEKEPEAFGIVEGFKAQKIMANNLIKELDKIEKDVLKGCTNG